jgi:hypothetical protein
LGPGLGGFQLPVEKGRRQLKTVGHQPQRLKFFLPRCNLFSTNWVLDRTNLADGSGATLIPNPMKPNQKLSKLLAWGLLATLPLMAGMCGGPPPEPETAQSAPPVTQPPTEAPVCRDSIALEVTEGPFLRTNWFSCGLTYGLMNNGTGPGLEHFHRPYNYVINTQEEYESMVSCGRWLDDGGRDHSLPKVDFTKHTLLTGEMYTAVLGFPRNIKFSQACGEYRLSLNLWPGGGAAALAVSPYFVLVPKLPPGAKVKFNVYSKFCLSPVGDCP